MRPRRRAGGLLVGALVLFVIGTNIQAGWLFVLAALLVGAVVVGALLGSMAVRGLEVSLEAPAEAAQGSEALLTVQVTNRTRAVRWGVVVADPHLGDAQTYLGRIRPGERVRATTVRVPTRRGVVHTQAVQLRSAVPFGIVERRRRVPVDATTLVLPQVVLTGPLWFVEPAMSSEPAGDVERRRGTGPDYVAVREHRAGDPMRHVHWGLTARHGQLMVREFEQERTPRVAIWIDTELDGDALDRCCIVAASIVDAATTTGAGVRLAAPAAGGELSLATRRSRADLLRWLALLAPSGTPPAHGLRLLTDGALAGVGTLVVALAGVPTPEVIDALELAAGWVQRVVVVTVGGAAPVRPTRIDVRTWGAEQDLAVCLAGRERSAEVPA